MHRMLLGGIAGISLGVVIGALLRRLWSSPAAPAAPPLATPDPGMVVPAREVDPAMVVPAREVDPAMVVAPRQPPATDEASPGVV